MVVIGLCVCWAHQSSSSKHASQISTFYVAKTALDINTACEAHWDVSTQRTNKRTSYKPEQNSEYTVNTNNILK